MQPQSKISFENNKAAVRCAMGFIVFFVLLGSSCTLNVGAAPMNKDGLPLPMSFTASREVLLLFSWWRAESAGQYVLCCLCCVLFGFVSIALKVLRRVSEMLLFQEEKLGKAKVIFGSFPVYHNAIRGVVAFLNYCWDYMLMLVAMTFNVGIFISLLGGVAIGFLTIGHYLDYEPSSSNRCAVSTSCTCDKEMSCGCHRGFPCTCYKASKLVQLQNIEALGGTCKHSTTV